MIYMNLKRLRNQHQYTQEMLAEKLGVSRQVIAKWERGDSTPDLDLCIKLADLYGVTLDNLVNYNEDEAGLGVPPKGKHVFGLSFMALFAGQIIAKDRTSEFLTRLFTTPMEAKDFILGYTLPLIPMALLQTILCFTVAIFLGMDFSFSTILAIIFILPIGLVFISFGLLVGSLFSEKTVGSICGALLTNVTALFSGAWFSVELVGGIFEKIAYVLPFYHGVEMARATMSGQYGEMLPHIWWVFGYGIVISIGAIYVFRKKKKM